MQNEFEKQVQQKMEELNLVPSVPVWQKVEMQIRKKKDRRRVIFWIPLLILVAGSLWLGIDQYSKRIAYNKGDNKNQKQNTATAPAQLENKTIVDNIDNKEPIVHNNKSENRRVTGITKEKLNDKKFISTGVQKSFSQNSYQKIKLDKEVSFAEKKKASSKVEETLIAESIITNKTSQELQEKTNVLDTSLNINHNDTIARIQEKSETQTTTSEPVKQDSTSTKKPDVRKHAVSKWKYNLVVVTGVSGLGRINFYNGQKSMSYSSNYSGGPISGGSSSGGGSLYNYGPSEVKKGLSFSIGTAVNRQLNNRAFFSAGLQYNYYSNTIEVGSRINQNRVIMDFAVSQFYSNQGSVLQPYKNQYHFVSLPFGIGWQLLKKHPLNFSTGLSLQYLVQTNALRFDYSSQSYFHNINAFNRVQLLSEFDLTYSVPLKQRPLTFGPQFQYGFTRLEEGNSDHHLFSYGLKAQWQLNKK